MLLKKFQGFVVFMKYLVRELVLYGTKCKYLLILALLCILGGIYRDILLWKQILYTPLQTPLKDEVPYSHS